MQTMDRRKFLSGVGTVGTIGAVATSLAVRESNATKARAEGLALAASGGSGSALQRASAASIEPRPHGVTLAYLPGSAGMFADPTVERLMRPNAKGLSWARWDPSQATQTSQSAIHSLFKVTSLVDLSVGVLRHADHGSSSMKLLEVTAHFAIDDAPYFAPFNVWSYEAAGPSRLQKSTQPLTFSARVPEHVALEVNYALQPSAITTSIAGAGKLYLPIGASAVSVGGLATGLYVLAATSASTGVQPDLSAYVFSGNVHAPISDPSGCPLDFDYLALAIRPAAV